MAAKRRLTGIVLLAALVAAAATLFGAVAVPEEHPAAGTSEHGHAESEHEDTLRPGEVTGALLVSLAGIGIVPLALASARRREDDERRFPPSELDRAQALRLAIAAASAGAATIHFAVIAQHLEDYWLFGSFFVGVAVLQLAWALLIVFSPSPRLYLAGAAGNAVVAATWLLSRTTGLPLGPEAGEPEPVGIADTVATGFEVLIAAGVVLLLFATASRRPLARFTAATTVTVLAAITLTALSLLSLAGL